MSTVYHNRQNTAQIYLEGGLVRLGPGTSVRLYSPDTGRSKVDPASLLPISTSPLTISTSISTSAASCHPRPQRGGQRLRRILSPEMKRIMK